VAKPVALASVGVAFLALFAIKSNFQRFPQGRFAQAAYPWLFAGLYLDEAFTRLAFRVWPPHFAGAAAAPAPIRIETTLEARP
jgi:hypothetical protein